MINLVRRQDIIDIREERVSYRHMTSRQDEIRSLENDNFLLFFAGIRNF